MALARPNVSLGREMMHRGILPPPLILLLLVQKARTRRSDWGQEYIRVESTIEAKIKQNDIIPSH